MGDDSFSAKEVLNEVKQEVRKAHDTLIAHMNREESQLENILLENKKTNGRVTALEADFHTLSVKSETMSTKIAMVTTFISLIVASIITIIINKLAV